MSEGLGPEKRPEEAKHFITEKIVGRESRGRRLIKHGLKAAFAGAIFSMAAVMTAVFLLPHVQARLAAEESSAALVTLPRDERDSTAPGKKLAAAMETKETGTEAETKAASQESGAAESAAARESASEGAAQAETLPEKREYSAADVQRLADILKGMANAADASIASVTHLREQKDWFDNPLRTAGIYSGVALAKTETELLILTTEEAALEADTLTVSFLRGSAMSARVKRTDSPTGLAVLSVPVTEENRSLIQDITPVPLGNSYRVRRGDMLLALGAPLGKVHSVDYGVVSYLTNGVSVTDGLASVAYTSCGSNPERGTWMLNLDGELVGWATEAFSEEAAPHTALLGVSDFKPVLERMMNGQASPMLGLRGSAVLPEMQEQGIPAGVYVVDVLRNEPLYDAGIQPGDIITRIDDSEIDSVRDLTVKLEEMHAEDHIGITVMRNGRESYTPIEFQVTVGARS